MNKPMEFFCEKCKVAVEVAIRAVSDRCEFKATGGVMQEGRQGVEVRCKKCRRPVATIVVQEA